jgi:hypothetical protein
MRRHIVLPALGFALIGVLGWASAASAATEARKLDCHIECNYGRCEATGWFCSCECIGNGNYTYPNCGCWFT